MKKLFLTSGIIACMACPAFAEVTTIYDANATGTQTGDCAFDPLGVYSGDVTVTADWDKAWYQIILDKNDGKTNGSPTPMYAVPGNDTNAGLYKSATTETDGTLTFSSANKIAANSVLLDAPAVGIYVNHTLNDNFPGGWTTGDTGVTEGSSTQQQRSFTGYYSAEEDGTPYTNGTTLLPAGVTAATSAAADQTWYAQYNCATPTLTDPVVPGYTFAGWSLASDANNTILSNFCIKQSDSLKGNWTPQTQHIEYSCGTKPQGATTNIAGNAPAIQDVLTDATYTLATLGEGECSLPGYTFAGWSCPNLPNAPQANGNGYLAEGSQGAFHYVGTITCTAQWTTATINITWEDNNATTAHVGGTTSCQYDSDITLPTTAPTRIGYEFAGWTVGTAD